MSLNVHAIYGTFVAYSHWVGLYIKTNEHGMIDTIQYIDPVGQSINSDLKNFIQEQTNIIAEDTTIGCGVQFSYIDDNGTEMVSNTNDCGPMLVQLFCELHIYGTMQTSPKNYLESIKFGQQCRAEQSYHNIASEQDDQMIVLRAAEDQLTPDQLNHVEAMIGDLAILLIKV